MVMEAKNFDILLVEDDSVDIMNVRRSFEKNNILNKLHIARDGIEALQMLRGDNVDKIEPLPKVVLLDINMPRMNGIEFLQEIRKDSELRSLCVFILTTSNCEKDRWQAYGLNVAGYILKPVSIGEFMTSMSTLHSYLQLIELP